MARLIQCSTSSCDTVLSSTVLMPDAATPGSQRVVGNAPNEVKYRSPSPCRPCEKPSLGVAGESQLFLFSPYIALKTLQGATQRDATLAVPMSKCFLARTRSWPHGTPHGTTVLSLGGTNLIGRQRRRLDGTTGRKPSVPNHCVMGPIAFRESDALCHDT